MKNISDNRKFWKTVKPLFSDKIQTPGSITLLEGDELVSEDKKVAEILNDYFVKITARLEISEVEENLIKTNELSDPINIAVNMYKRHPSIQLIKQRVTVGEKLSFQQVSLEEILSQLKNLDPSKASPFGSIPVKILTEHSDLFAPLVQLFINESIDTSKFPKELKKGDITSLFKNDDAFAKKNYRPITVLPAISKIYERTFSGQIAHYMENVLSPYQCAYRKGYNTQHALLRLIEKCRSFLDMKGFAGAILMGLSKAFDCLNHELLIAKLEAYGFSRSALKLVYDYLSNRKQRVKVNGSFSSWQESIKGVPQGSVLGPLLFNVFINDLFFLVEETDICNYADDTTIYVCGHELEHIVSSLETDAQKLSKWFLHNCMKLNHDKCHLLIFGEKNTDVSVQIGATTITESGEEKLLGVTLDKKLDFKNHVNTLCKKAGQKLHALARISNYVDVEKLRTMMNAFVVSQFSYCPLVWMFHDRSVDKKINKIHERALRIAYKDSRSNFEELLTKANAVSIHHKNLQLLATEIFKTQRNLNPRFMNQIFVEKDTPYTLRGGRNILAPKPNTTGYGIENARFLGAKIWHTMPSSLKESQTLNSFKKDIKNHQFDCNCRLCKRFVKNLGFL